jgi:trimethylamine--corrinoid protein Co-methyltransferase
MTMAKVTLSLLSAEEIGEMHDTSIRILERIGLKVMSEEILAAMEGVAGVSVDSHSQVVTFSEEIVMRAVGLAPKVFSVYGRDRSQKITYGDEGFVCQAIPGEAHWVEPKSRTRREGRWADFEKSVIVANYLPNIDIVGAMIQPSEVPVEVRDVHLYAELFKRTNKTVRSWVYGRRSAKYILEMAELLVGGADELRAAPIIEFGFEPVSPLQLPGTALEIAVDFAKAGIPITLGPMPQAMASGPVTLAGTVAQGNAEALGTLVILQTIAPGTPVIYYSAPHIMDPKTAGLVFSSPEQGLMGVAVTQLGKHYGLPVGINVGLTDAKIPDAQAGIEKGVTMVMGALAGADIFGAMGIAGMDQGFSLPQLIIDDELIGFVKRILRGMRVDEETLAYDVIEQVGIGGTFLTEDHTLEHWRDEFWIPQLSDRYLWETWMEGGGSTMLDRAVDRQARILKEQTLEWLDEEMQRELDAIVKTADEEIINS